MIDAVETHSPEETADVARRLAASLSPGAVVALYGELGAGKTHFVRGACEALGVDPSRVSSPTFTLVHEYGGEPPVYHFDAYRIRHPDEFFEMGYEEYFYDGGICFVEWPERVEALLPPDVVRLRLEHVREGVRRIGPMPGAPQR